MGYIEFRMETWLISLQNDFVGSCLNEDVQVNMYCWWLKVGTSIMGNRKKLEKTYLCWNEEIVFQLND